MIEIKLFRLRLDMKTPFHIAHGSCNYRENIFIRLKTNEITAWGEAPVVPYYGVNADDIEADLRSVLSSAKILEGPRPFRYPASICAYESVSIHMQSAAEQKSITGFLDIQEQGENLQTSCTLAYEDDIESMVRRAVTSGYRRLKIKAGIPGDIERIAEIRKQLPEALIRVDANQGWSVQEAPTFIAQLERIGVEMIEEPIKGTPAEIDQLARSTSIPIVLDESILDENDIHRFEKQAPHLAGIVVKIAKNGGPAASASLIGTARNAGLKIMLSSMIESSVGIASALPLAPLCTWLDLDAPLLLAKNPFTGLKYLDETPVIQSGGIEPVAELDSCLENVPSIIVGERDE